MDLRFVGGFCPADRTSTAQLSFTSDASKKTDRDRPVLDDSAISVVLCVRLLAGATPEEHLLMTWFEVFVSEFKGERRGHSETAI